MTRDDDNRPAEPPPPSTPVSFGDPTLDRDALSEEERRSIGPRRLSSSDRLFFSIIALHVLACVIAAVASRGPSLDHDLERPRVREAVLRHQLAEASRFVDADESVFCLSLFHGVDPTAELLARFADHSPPVLPVSRCYLADGEARSRSAWLFSVGNVSWLWSGDVEVMAGASGLSRYTLRLHEGDWRVVRAELIGR